MHQTHESCFNSIFHMIFSIHLWPFSHPLDVSSVAYFRNTGIQYKYKVCTFPIPVLFCFLYVFGLISPLPPPNSYTYIWPLAAGWPNNSPLCGGAEPRPWAPLSILIIWPCCPQTSGTRRQIIHSLHYTLWAVPLCVSLLMEKQGKHTVQLQKPWLWLIPRIII